MPLKYLSKSFEVFLERAGGVEPGDGEIPAPIRRERIGTSGGGPLGRAPGRVRIQPFFREEKRVCGTPPARS
ncbi:hypothetical protein [Nitrosococcus wardiae]|uniref:Uncharacterized protein n=1 Tax=Nitrosococcus wardiae TaxID=1814290 RepID=A0A4P7BXL6_9GAMM|nr:hypothetical protein [Nitrosococcus wardiae]QBQ53860.1 hypothetical protein E3U44_04545 [Nitrosococcus wardiae]